MSDIQSLEAQLKQAKESVAQRDKIDKLMANREFKELILDGFIRDESARLAHVSGDPVLSEKDQRDCVGMAQAGGHLKRFLNVLVSQANTAERQIPDIEAAIDEMRREGEDD